MQSMLNHVLRKAILDFIPLFFLQYNVKAPKYSPQKRISFHKRGGGHRFMKLFRKIDVFLKDGFPKEVIEGEKMFFLFHFLHFFAI